LKLRSFLTFDGSSCKFLCKRLRAAFYSVQELVGLQEQAYARKHARRASFLKTFTVLVCQYNFL